MTPSRSATDCDARSPSIHATTPVTVLRTRLAGDAQEFQQTWRASQRLVMLSAGLLWPLARQRVRRWLLTHIEVDGEPLRIEASGATPLGGLAVATSMFLLLAMAVAMASVLLGWEPRTRNALAVVAAVAFIPWVWGRQVHGLFAQLRWRSMRVDFWASNWDIYRAFWPLFLGVGLLDAWYWLAAGASQTVQPWTVAIGVGVTATLMVPCLEYRLVRLAIIQATWARVPLRGEPPLGAYLAPTLVTAAGTGAALGLAALVDWQVATVLPSLHPARLLALLDLQGLHGAQALWASLPLGAAALCLALLALADLACAPLRAWRAARVLRAIWGNIGIEGFASTRCELDAPALARLRMRNLLRVFTQKGSLGAQAMLDEWTLVCASLRVEVEAVPLDPTLAPDTEPLEESVKRADTPDSVRPLRVATQGT